MAETARPPYRLLITDDDARFREVLCGIFAPHCDLVEAECGEAAIEIVQREHVDLILLDMNMHVLTGLQTLRIVKSIHILLPCILITADANEDLRRDAAEAQAYDVLRKPVRQRELLSTVTSALKMTYNDPQVLHWMASAG